MKWRFSASSTCGHRILPETAQRTEIVYLIGLHLNLLARGSMKNPPQAEIPMFLGEDYIDTDLPMFLCRCGELRDCFPADRTESLGETGPDEPETYSKVSP
jgi:hypothetical protein